MRETREETGLEVELRSLVGVYSEPNETVVLIVYSGRPTGGIEQADDDLEELGWFEPTALPDLAFSRDSGIIATWFTGHQDRHEAGEPSG